MQTTPAHIVERNRSNALRSTGPSSKEGKAISRRNAIKHGMTANPAAGVIEDRSAFERLHEALEHRFCPNDALEEGLVHRITVCLWRLQRGAQIDGAVSEIRAQAVSSNQEHIQGWVTEITQKFTALEWVQVTDPELIRQRVLRKPETKGKPWYRTERRFLSRADHYRDNILLSDGTAMQAMILLIKELTRQLEFENFIEPARAQMLAWLLGESADRLVQPEDAEDRDAHYYPDERPYASTIDNLIGQARKQDRNSPLPSALKIAVEARLTDLEVKSRSAASPYTEEQEIRLKTEALLLDAETLDRLMRYEGHAERSLLRAIDTLSKLRGVTVESIRATMTRPEQGGETSVEICGERRTWSGS